MMIKPVSILAIMIVGVMSAIPSNAVQMTSQIQRLLEEKEEKVKQLEECEGKKQGWMIAGISTIGLTAVGVGVNIAQANKSNKLSSDIDDAKRDLQWQQERLSKLESDISKKKQEKAEREKAEREKAEPERAGSYNVSSLSYDDYELSCTQTSFRFNKDDVDTSAKFRELNDNCRLYTGADMVTLGAGLLGGDIVIYECLNYRQKMNCSNPVPVGVIGGVCNIGGLESGKAWVYKEKADGKYVCFVDSQEWIRTVPCECEETDQIGAIIDEIPGKIGKTAEYGTVTEQNEETSLQKCLRERSGDAEGTACCYLSKSVAEYVGGKCECKGGKEFSIDTNGRGVCSGQGVVKPKDCADGYVRIIGAGDNSECVKRDYLITDKCACKDGTNNCELKKDANGPFVCQLSKGWGKKCICEDCPGGMVFDDSIKKCEAKCDGIEYKGVCLPSGYATDVYNFSNYCKLQRSGTYFCAKKEYINKLCTYLGGSTKSATDMFYCNCSSVADNCKKVFYVH